MAHWRRICLLMHWEACSIPVLGSFPREGNGNPLHYSCLGNPLNRGAWWATVHGFTRIRRDLATKQQQCILGKFGPEVKVEKSCILKVLEFSSLLGYQLNNVYLAGKRVLAKDKDKR